MNSSQEALKFEIVIRLNRYLNILKNQQDRKIHITLIIVCDWNSVQRVFNIK